MGDNSVGESEPSEPVDDTAAEEPIEDVDDTAAEEPIEVVDEVAPSGEDVGSQNTQSDTDDDPSGRGESPPAGGHAQLPDVRPDVVTAFTDTRAAVTESAGVSAEVNDEPGPTVDTVSLLSVSQIGADDAQLTTTSDTSSGEITSTEIVQELVSDLLELGELGTDTPAAPETPIEWVLLAVSRREVGDPEVGQTATASIDTTGQVVDESAAGDDEVSDATILAAAVPAVEPADWDVTNTIPRDVFGTDPEGVAISPDGTRIYVTSYDAGRVTVIDAATMTVIDADDNPENGTTTRIVVGGSATSVAVSPDGTRLYVTNWDDQTVEVFDTANNAWVDSIPVGVNPEGVAVSPDGTRLYVTNDVRDEDGIGTVTVIDVATKSAIDTDGDLSNGVTSIPVGRFPVGIAVSPSGSLIYVVNELDGTMMTIDAETFDVIDTVEVGSRPQGVAVSAVNGALYITSRTAGTVTVIDTANNTVVQVIPIGDAEGVAVHPAGNRIYVTSNSGGLQEITLDFAPVAVDDSYTATEDTTLEITAPPGVLANDTDIGDILTAVAETKTTVRGGTVTINADGSFAYTPPADFSGTDSFTYSITDGDRRTTATVTVTVVSVDIEQPTPDGGLPSADPPVVEPVVVIVEPVGKPDMSRSRGDSDRVATPVTFTPPMSPIRANSASRTPPPNAPTTYESTDLAQAAPPAEVGVTSRVGTGTQAMTVTLIFFAIGGWFFVRRLTPLGS